MLAKWLKPIRENKFGHVASVLIVFIFCNLAWVFFRAESFSDATYVICHSLDGITNPISYMSNPAITKYELLLLLIYIGILAVYDFIDYRADALAWIGTRHKVFQWLVYIAIGLIVVFCSQKGVAAEFIYFQF